MSGQLLGPAWHVLTEVDHFAVFAALGLLAGQQERRARFIAFACLAIALAASMSAPLFSDAFEVLSQLESVLSSGSLAVTGVLVALYRRLAAWLLAAVLVVVGSLHGLANGLHFSDQGDSAVSVAGAVAAALLVAAACALLSAALKRPAGRIVVRVLGSWAAALGLILLGLALR